MEHGRLRNYFAALALVIAPVVAGCASTSGPASAPAEQSSAAFQRLLALEGSWTGTFEMSGQTGETAVDYRVTGGGTALQETLFRGTPHEMVTFYHLDGDRLVLTHYCAAGNQPTMVLTPGTDPAVLRFDLLRVSNLASPESMFMHDAEFDLSEPGRLRTAWTSWEEGKPGPVARLDLRRSAK